MINHSSLENMFIPMMSISLTKAIQIFSQAKLTAAEAPIKLKCKKCEVGSL